MNLIYISVVIFEERTPQAYSQTNTVSKMIGQLQPYIIDFSFLFVLSEGGWMTFGFKILSTVFSFN